MTTATTEAGTHPGSQLAWGAMAAVGVVFLVVGAAQMIGIWVPSQLGTPEWEYGSASEFFDTFPLLGLGLTLLIGHGVATARPVQVRVLATACVLLAVLMWLAFTLFATTFPIALKVVTNPVTLTPIKKAAAKTAVQALLYPFALLWLAGAAWRATLKRRGKG
jgi:hypothetical protein